MILDLVHWFLCTNMFCLSVRFRENAIEKEWLEAAKSLLSLGAPDSVLWCSGQCPVRQTGSGELAALETSSAAYG